MFDSYRIVGASPLDDVFSIDHLGEEIMWNVTRLRDAAKAGKFGPPRFAATVDLPPARWDDWDETDRKKVDAIKANQELLDDPAIGIASPIEAFAMLCFADGQHRITARQELALPEIAFYLVPTTVEGDYRVTITPL